MVGSVALLLLLFEAALRIRNGGPARPPLMFSPGGNHPQYLFMPDTEHTYRLRPYFVGEMREPYGDFDLTVRINALGLRDHHDPRPTSALRILGVGDSFTYGEGVEENETYLARLEYLMNSGGGPRVECINGGVPGYSLLQVRALLARIEPVYQPRLVILGWEPWFYNREYDPFVYFNGYIVRGDYHADLKAYGDLVLFSSWKNLALRAIDFWGQAHSQAYTFFKWRVVGGIMDRFARQALFTENFNAVNFGVPLDRIEQIEEDCRSRGAGFLLFAICFSHVERDKVSELFRERGIPTLTVLVGGDSPPGQRPERYLFAHDSHPNAAGHDLLAHELLVFLRDHPELLQGRPAGAAEGHEEP